MINLTITVDNITDVLTLFDRVEILKYNNTDTPTIPVDLSDYSTIDGIDKVNNREHVSDVILSSTYTQYYFVDPDGISDNWYISRYFNTTTSGSSGWSDPVQGEDGDLLYNPLYPPEEYYNDTEKNVINRIRILIGDPIGIEREYGEGAGASIHSDGKVYELDDKGWPISINMYGTQYLTTSDPIVNGYRYLKFKQSLSFDPVTVSGITYYVDLWYHTFRFSDKQIMDVYNNTPPPPPLNSTNCTQEIYMLQTAYDLLSSESWENINEDGAYIKDGESTYDPSSGLKVRADMLAKLRKRLDDAIKSNRLLGITGVLID